MVVGNARLPLLLRTVHPSRRPAYRLPPRRVRRCKNCTKLAPFCEALAAKMPGIAFGSVDIDEADELVEEYAVTAVPHFVLLKGGAKVGEYVGSKDADLEAAIVKALG